MPQEQPKQPPGPPPGPPPKLPPSETITSKPGEPSNKIDSSTSVEEFKIDDIPDDPIEMEKKFTREKIQFFQELELDRILNESFKLNPYDLLDCSLESDSKEITKIYRKKSLLIHPDKVDQTDLIKKDRAQKSFDLLKQASNQLLDEEKRKKIDEVIISARLLCLRELGIPSSSAIEDIDFKTDKRIQNLFPSFDERVKKCTKEIMIDDELRKRRLIKLQHQTEGEEERKRDREATEKKRKIDEKQEWENNRQDRIDNWRQFHHQKGGGKSKKKKTNSNGLNVLG